LNRVGRVHVERALWKQACEGVENHACRWG
jgi:hypothetical protein